MTILVLLGFFFLWLVSREFRQSNKMDSFTITYTAICFMLGVLCMIPMVRHLQFENFLEKNAEALTDGKEVNLSCTTAFESMFDRFGAAGTGNPYTGKIVIQYPYCKYLRGFLKNPDNPTIHELWSLNTFTHEAMHIRGELNEQKTECQSIQRNHVAAVLLGLRESTADRAAIRYYKELYPRQKNNGYYSKDCAPGKALDEKLPGAIWQRSSEKYEGFGRWRQN